MRKPATKQTYRAIVNQIVLRRTAGRRDVGTQERFRITKRLESAVTGWVRPSVTLGDRFGKHKIMPADSGNERFTLKSAHYVFMEGVRGAAY